MESEVEGWIMGLPQDSELKKKLRSADEKWLQDKYKKYVSYLTTEAGSMINNMTKLYTSQIDSLKAKGAQIQYDERILDLIRQDIIPRQFLPSEQMIINRVGSNSSIGSLTTIVNSNVYNFSQQAYMNSRKVVEVPVQDTRTKALIHKLATEMRRLYTKYPQLVKEISPELS